MVFVILEYFIAFAETAMSYCFAFLLLQMEKPKKRDLWLYGICTAVMAGLSTFSRSLLIISWTFLLFESLCLALSIHRISRQPLGRSFLLFASYHTLRGICDIFLILVSCLLLRHPEFCFEIAGSYSVLRIVLLLSVRLLSAAVLLCLRRQVKNLKFIRLNGNLLFLLFAVSFLILLYLIAFYGDRSNVYVVSSALLVISLLFLCAVMTACLSYQNSREVLETVQVKNYMLEKYINEIKEEYQTNQKLHHDMKNHITVLRQLLSQKDYDAVQAYLDALVPQTPQSLGTEWTGNRTIDLILNQKIKEMEKENIPCTICAAAVGELPVSDKDLCVIFANLMDNMIEASQKLEPPQRNAAITIARQNSMLFLSMENKCKIEKQKLRLCQSDKADKKNHGYGLASVSEAVRQYHGDFEYHRQGDLFSVKILLPI